MRKFLTQLLAGAVVLSLSTAASAALILHEPFLGSPGNLVANAAAPSTDENVWTRSGANADGAIQIVADSLTFPWLEASTGNKIVLTGATGFEDAGYTYPAAQGISGDGNFAYYSFLFRQTAIPAGSQGDYFIHVTDGTGVDFRGRFFIRRASETQFEMGINFGGSSSPQEVTQYAPGLYDLNTTYFVVVKLSLIAGADNDTADVFINPMPGDPEPVSSDVSSTVVGGRDIGPAPGIIRVNVRQGTTSQGTQEVDEIRIGTTWADVTPQGDPPATSVGDDWMMYR